MTTQLTIGEALAQEGMQRATEASDPDAITRLDQLIAHHAATGEPFSANTIRAQLPEGIRPGAVGARFGYAARRGLIRGVDWVSSTDPRTHRHVIHVWQGTGRAA
ncbi:hypothetical protein [Nocardiopsis lucentensis]|uniref:hypothetical protein n=1 Tax=Nocardiopsis lucentensis TaxID=53441 RepID=UPI000344E3D0|nr:hypothetical protein [Nocardiopsis lucentensis]